MERGASREKQQRSDDKKGSPDNLDRQKLAESHAYQIERQIGGESSFDPVVHLEQAIVRVQKDESAREMIDVILAVHGRQEQDWPYDQDPSGSKDDEYMSTSRHSTVSSD